MPGTLPRLVFSIFARMTRRLCKVVSFKLLIVAFSALIGTQADAASLSTHDLQILGRVLAFTQLVFTGEQTVAIVYAIGNEASRRDAELIAAEIGNGLRVGAILLRPRLVDTASLATGGFTVLIAADGAAGVQLIQATRREKALCVTASFAAVEAGDCIMAIRSEPRVEILVNHTAAIASGIEFAAAFRMMIREI